MAKPKVDRRVAFDELWREWQAAPPGPRKQRLLDRLVRENTPLVQKFVTRMLRHSVVYCEPDDAMQAGLIGLLTALKKYDPNRPTRFSTMAYPWVRHEVSNMLQHQTQLYRPKGAGMPYKEHRREEAIVARTGREASAADLGVSDERLAKWRAAVFHFVPLDEPKDGVMDDQYGHARRLDSLRDAAPLADEQLADAEETARVRAAVAKLTHVERRILIEEDHFLPDEMCKVIRARALDRLRRMLG